VEESKSLVLVAEDDPSIRGGVIHFLELEGHEVVGVADGAALLQKIRGGRRPDLVVLDLEMPVLSGWEFLAIREADPVLLLIPVIVISGEASPPAEIGRNACISKPVRWDELRELVDTILDQSHPDPKRIPRRTEPWSVDERKPNVVRNSFGHVVAFVASSAEARRLVAAVNGISRISTDALEQGIIDKGLECLYDLNRYDTDEDYRRALGGEAGHASILSRRREIVSLLEQMAYSQKPTAPN
jgi:CheY-like chemotaxis protein